MSQVQDLKFSIEELRLSFDKDNTLKATTKINSRRY